MFCPYPAPEFLIFSSEVPSLLYYSHLPTAIFALVFGFYIFARNKKSSENQLLFGLTLIYFILIFLNLVLWTNIDSRVITVAWLYSQIFYLALPICAAFLFYAFVYRQPLPGLLKISGAAAISILALAAALGLTGSYFDLINCELVETQFVQWYQNFVFLAIFIFIIWGFFRRLRMLEGSDERRRVSLFTIGTLLFLGLLIFTWQIASEYDLFELEQYGVFGMTIFMTILGYLIVRYNAFDIRLLGAQALVIALVMLIGSQFFFIQNIQNYVLNGIGFALSFVAGYFLIRSVQKEVERKEELQRISDSLAKANERLKELDQSKSEFISIASHQLRTPLTAIKGYISLLLEGSYGKVPAAIEDTLNKVYSVNDRLIQLVEDLLNVSRIEAGRIQYTFEETQIESLMADLVDSFKLSAKTKGLALNLKLPDPSLPKLMIDPNKLKEVASNIIDNALKYTKEGSVDVIIESVGETARISVKDTGIGIKPEDQRHLFQKFVRSKETTRMVVGGAGLGLFVGKSFIEAMGGKVRAESEGAGKGSTFIIELPLKNSGQKAGITERPSA